TLKQTQADILDQYSKMLKPGGKMVYATCSILPSENREQIAKFLKSESGKDFVLEKEKTVLSSESGYDGFYMALLIKN
ncbi:MAG TPA: RNA methyltransferase, partial [Salinimicrobium sp.]|nr:RNA methyltransferase [Salinimicrobium sp.]